MLDLSLETLGFLGLDHILNQAFTSSLFLSPLCRHMNMNSMSTPNPPNVSQWQK